MYVSGRCVRHSVHGGWRDGWGVVVMPGLISLVTGSFFYTREWYLRGNGVYQGLGIPGGKGGSRGWLYLGFGYTRGGLQLV